MSSRAAARGKAAANSIRLTSRTSKAVATSRASPSRCFLFCRGSRAARSAPIAVATVAIPPTRKPPQARRVSPITERSSAPGNLMGGKDGLGRHRPDVVAAQDPLDGRKLLGRERPAVLQQLGHIANEGSLPCVQPIVDQQQRPDFIRYHHARPRSWPCPRVSEPTEFPFRSPLYCTSIRNS